MVWATGDTHGKFERFNRKCFPELEALSREDIMIITGDFGGVWFGDHRDDKWLDWLEDRPFTTAFVDGNHENFDVLAKYPVEEWNGGKVHFIRPHVIHLMRGQVFTIQGHTFFTMGGASSYDIEDGILEPGMPDFRQTRLEMEIMGCRFRVNHQTWWKEELPSDEEYAVARKNLDTHRWEIDYIITHSPPSGFLELLGSGFYPRDKLTDFLEEVRQRARYHDWLFGHCHRNEAMDKKHILLWEQIVQVI